MPSLTYAPLPKLYDIFKSVLHKKIADTELAALWLRNTDKGYWFSRSAWSLYAIAKFRQQVTEQNNIKVFLPDYFCNESIAPLRTLGVELFFYPILANGKPDLNGCDNLVTSNRPDIFVIVHYFGEPSYVKGLRKIIEETSAWLVEDAAHILKPIDEVGVFGDFVLYSPHKFLPIPDGALLVIRENGPSKINSEFIKVTKYDELYLSILNKEKTTRFTPFIWLVKRLLQKIGVRGKENLAKFKVDTSVMDTANFISPRMSGIAKKMLQIKLPYLEIESRSRKLNRRKWYSALNHNGALGDDIVLLECSNTPYQAVFCALSSNKIEELFIILKTLKIPVSSWPDLPPEVINKSKNHKVALKLRHSRFFLPVHQSIDSLVISSIVNVNS